MSLQTDDFDYDLPPERIAQQPLAQRDQSRLMVLHRATGRCEHRVFSEVPELLRDGDVLALNDTRVIPARFFCRRGTGGRVEGLFIREAADGRWHVMLKNAGRCRPGERLIAGDGVELELAADEGAGHWMLKAPLGASAMAILDRIGQTPLPPYIRRPDDSHEAADRPRYQTVYADRPGAVAAPTAGLHFTPAVFEALDARGIERVTLTLHVGLGTFLPVKTARPAEHTMHAEWYDLSDEAADKLSAARQDGRRIVAVGTTSVRVLETVAREKRGQATFSPSPPCGSSGHGGRPSPEKVACPLFFPASDWTDIFIYPPADFRATDALITNFHLPKSTLLMLVAAFCSPGTTDGVKMILDAYAEAVQREYRFYSYGDAMLIE